MTKEEAKEFIKTEPDIDIFEAFGYPCIILRQPEGNLNGYVGIPKEHHLYGKSYNDKIYTNRKPIYRNNPIEMVIHAIDDKKEENEYRIGSIMNVHGGVTYSNEHFPIKEISEEYRDLWWFAFDTAHSGDMRPLEEDIDIELMKNNPNSPEEFKKMFDLLEIFVETFNSVVGSEKSLNEIMESEKKRQTYRTFEYVKLETQILAKNLKYYE